ncbi:diaminopimelate decarboxylase [Brucella pseudogrignonensis]|uniref:diaminopimelate decarboxylase n=1 Tax=Brucella pseudogrignonensis TaxID=419475 RepID=UPI0028B6CB9E|nr:diaminopimelate decarboxylase [Brucella pseudogrignonensis]MDT6942177.1 diaminopimelate decarboxylase [Brucella pseudogrignonensis]
MKTSSSVNQRQPDSTWFSYKNGELHAEQVRLSEIAQDIPTPFYCYSTDAIKWAYQTLAEELNKIDVSICFAVKANSNIAVLRLLAELGCGMDIVSGGELERVLAAGIPAKSVIFSGIGKTRQEIKRALKVGVHQINVESAAELDEIVDIARFLKVRAPVALRVNPDVDAKTHAKITTATKKSKFGIPIAEVPGVYAAASKCEELELKGLAVHVGSQMQDLSPFRHTFSTMSDLVRNLRSQGLEVPHLDLGGGIGISVGEKPGPDVKEYAAIIAETVGNLGCKLTVEPGRWLVGRAGLLVTEVLYLKNVDSDAVAIIDGGMNDLIRPALYDATHPVIPINEPEQNTKSQHRIVGPICESSDDFGYYDGLGKLAAGDLVAFDCAGAYGATMSSTYNSRDLIAEVLVEDDRYRLIRNRLDIREQLKIEDKGEWKSAVGF